MAYIWFLGGRKLHDQFGFSKPISQLGVNEPFPPFLYQALAKLSVGLICSKKNKKKKKNQSINMCNFSCLHPHRVHFFTGTA